MSEEWGLLGGFFVLGIFLLSRSWKPVVTQVTAFTLAHSLTLGLAAAGYVKVPASVVEPIIAASIAAVALENIFRPDYSRWRLLIVAVFGAFHGLGFASGLSEHGIPQDGFIIALTGFNLGVEGAQLAIIAAAFAATCWLRAASPRCCSSRSSVIALLLNCAERYTNRPDWASASLT